MEDALGDRMKGYEALLAGQKLMPLLPALARIDGRGFTKFTRGLRRPFDERLSRLMIETTRRLVAETGARVGYCQSDEISLCWLADTHQGQIFFDGRMQKMVSTLAASATVIFNRLLPSYLPTEYLDREPTFDCRVSNVPNREEAANVFLWRELDATKNSVSMAARYYYPHAELEGKSGEAMQELLRRKGVNWNDYPRFFKRGTFIQRRTRLRKFTFEELDRLPEKHAARRDPELLVERSEYAELEMPPFRKVTNRVAVIFEGEEPVTAGE